MTKQIATPGATVPGEDSKLSGESSRPLELLVTKTVDSEWMANAKRMIEHNEWSFEQDALKEAVAEIERLRAVLARISSTEHIQADKFEYRRWAEAALAGAVPEPKPTQSLDELLKDDLRHYGSGFAKRNADGSIERVDPKNVTINK